MVVGSKRFKAPSTSKMLGDFAEGEIVLLNEGGSPVEFYVAKHDYESGLNGTGRTLLVRKDCYELRAWSSSKNAYASCDLDSWLNSTYKALLNENVQNAIGATKFYYTPGNGDANVTTLSRSIFALSVTELGSTGSSYNMEGSTLPIASVLQIAKLNGSASTQWTRTPAKSTTSVACFYTASGSSGSNSCGSRFGARPAFTLPTAAMFNVNTNAFEGVA